MFRAVFAAIVLAALQLFAGSRAQAAEISPRAVVLLLDYVAQDYAGAVTDGKVNSVPEYDEIREFSRRALDMTSELPEFVNDPRIRDQYRVLLDLIDRRAPASAVAGQARLIKTEIIARTKLQVAPAKWPDLERGAQLFQQACAACHGTRGRGDGPVAAAMTPRPPDFQNDVRMREQAPFQVFNAVRLGIPGTAMPSFEALTEDETWALAFFVVSLRYRAAAPPPAARTPVDVTVAASESDAQIERRLTGSPAEKLQTVAAIRLRSGATGVDQSLSTAVKLLRETEASYRSGDYSGARSNALSAYLEGVEPAEAQIRSREPAMVGELERRMGAVRNAIEERRPSPRVSAAVGAAIATISSIQQRLRARSSSPWLIFSMAAAIVLREGFEAILIIVAILAVLRALGARHAVWWVHAGWIAAVGFGVLAWLLSDWLMQASGLKREMIEAGTSLIAVVVLLYLGFWLHRRTQIGRWKAFIEEQVTAALSSRRLFGLTLISFFAVFREAIETVLFLVSLSLDGGRNVRPVMAAGVAASLVSTIVLAWAMLRFSARLPLRTIFGVTSVLMMVLSVILAGKGSRALQELGTLSVTGLRFDFTLDLLGVYPTVETIIAQVLITAASALLWMRARAVPAH